MNSDSQALVLLCSMIGRADDEPIRPLGPREWSDLERKIASSNLENPGGLLALSAGDVARELELDRSEADRIVALLGRGRQMELELERLSERGIDVVTRVDSEYPSRLLNSLKHVAPPVLFVAGRRRLLDLGGIAAVGSRNIDESGQAFATEIGRKCALNSLPLISGGARGADAMAMQSSVEAGGTAVGVLADSLERAVRGDDLRDALESGNLALMTPYSPGASFTVGAAMGRNRLIYALADYAVVVSSEVETGGTWRGATEALKRKWCPVFVRTGDDSPAGNLELLKKGALALPLSELKAIDDIEAWMKQHSGDVSDQEEDSKAGEQRTLFD